MTDFDKEKVEEKKKEDDDLPPNQVKEFKVVSKCPEIQSNQNALKKNASMNNMKEETYLSHPFSTMKSLSATR